MYKSMSDVELIQKIKENDNDAMEFLIKKYMGMVNKESRKLYLIGAENEDLIQEGMIGLIKAIRKYNGSEGASFSTYANMCIRGQMINAVKTSNRKKHSPLNSYVSFYETGTDNNTPVIAELEAGQDYEPEEILLEKMKSRKLYDNIERKLSKYEKKVLEEYLTGDSYEMISERLNKTEKSIDNAIQRIRRKLRETQEPG